MAELKTSDFYYGAILSHFVNNGICPVLLEAGKDRQLYEFMTDNRDFVLFAKYRSKTTTSKEDYISWTFQFTQNDLQELQGFLDNARDFTIGLVCSSASDDEETENHVAFLHKEELYQILNAGKKSFTISHSKGKHSYEIHMKGSGKNSLTIECNRSY